MKAMILLAAAALAAPAFASDNGVPDPNKPANPPKKERKICRQEQITSSLHGSHRTCLTAEEWKHRDRSSEDIDPRAGGNAR
ncbi:MAG: hypothetical protein QOH04_1614 [Sphingomonadales bacterium]|jgi:hypothetical protein|nr:hypothetical protein [Sphingomonadales bacterium]MEA3035849.1 hypothetical protein [Sphingomonadales bacterium]